MKSLNPSALRANIYKVLDRVIATGQPVLVQRKGQLLQISPPQKKSRLSRLKKKKIFLDNPADLAEIKWDQAWNPKLF